MYSPWIDENDTLEIDGTQSISKTKSITGKIPQARFQHAAVCANDSIFVIGGTNGKTFFEDMYMYEPEIIGRALRHTKEEMRQRLWASSILGAAMKLVVFVRRYL